MAWATKVGCQIIMGNAGEKDANWQRLSQAQQRSCKVWNKGFCIQFCFL